MNIVLLQTHLTEDEINKLIEEFPSFLFIAPSEFSYKKLGKDDWEKVEIAFGSHLTVEELKMAKKLRWMHSPTSILSAICLKEIEKRGNIIVTCTKEENSFQVAEYVLGTSLAFSKNLFKWERADKNPSLLWDSYLRETMSTLKNKTFLQIGLGTLGSEITNLAKNMKMHVWGAQKSASFHPQCQKNFSYDNLSAALPFADVISIALPRGSQEEFFLKHEMLKLMKEGSILVIVGSRKIIDEKALAKEGKKFRGIALDAHYQMPLAVDSPLWGLNNMIITPEIAPRPKSFERGAYRIFRFNLRQYIHGNFIDMRNVIGTKTIFIT